MAAVSTNDHANHSDAEPKGTAMNVQVVLSGSDLELFQRQAAFTLEMAADNLQEALRWQREGKDDVDDEEVTSWRARLRRAEDLLDRAAGRGQVKIKGDPHTILVTLEGCMLKATDELGGIVERGRESDWASNVREALAGVEMWVEFVYARRDSAGREAWYGHWRTNGRQVKRRIGSKRSEGTTDGLTRRQAEAELRRIINETPAVKAVGERITIAELGRRYIAQLERQGRKKATKVAVNSILLNWLEPFFGERSLDSIKPEDVVDLMRLMENGERLRSTRPRADGKSWPRSSLDKPVGPKSIRNYVGTLSALFNFAERKGWASGNPAHRVDLPGVAYNEDIRFLEPDEVLALADAAVAGGFHAIDRALYLTAAMTGLREGELVALRWRDVDWQAGRVRVRQNYVLGEFGTPKSRRSTRSVPMADAVAGELDRLFQASTRQEDEDLVFADPATGGPLSKRSLLKRYRRALAAAQLDTAHTFHHLRHTFGTRMAATGVPMRTLQEWMGHRNIETTQRYADYAPSAQESALVAAAFGPPTPAVVR
jgi:integrase